MKQLPCPITVPLAPVVLQVISTSTHHPAFEVPGPIACAPESATKTPPNPPRYKRNLIVGDPVVLWNPRTFIRNVLPGAKNPAGRVFEPINAPPLIMSDSVTVSATTTFPVVA